MSLASSSSGRRLPLRLRGARRRRRATLQSRFVPRVVALEERCLLTSASSVLGTETLVNTTVAGNQSFSIGGDRSIAVTGSGTTITVWASTDANGSRIVAQRTGADGAPLGGEFQVSANHRGTRSDPVVAASADGQFVVAWVSRGNPQDPSGLGVFARVFSADGSPETGEFRVNATVRGDQQDPSIDWVSDGGFVVAWSGPGKGQRQTVFARVFDASGSPVTGEIRVPGTRSGAQRDPVVVSLPSGGFQVAWDGNGKGDANGIFSRQFDDAGKPVGPEFRVNTAKKATEQQPAIARDGNGQVVIAWQSRGDALDPSGLGVVARSFALDGSPLGGEFLLNQTKRGNQSDPSISFLSDGRLAATWQGAGVGDSNGIFLREFYGDGTPRGGEQLVNTTVAGSQVAPTVQADPSGGYIVAWSGQVGGGPGRRTLDKNGIATQRFGDALITIPANTPGFTSPSDVLWYDASATDPKFMKTITITNQSPTQTIYPFLEDANNRTPLPTDPAPSPQYQGTGTFDPFDPINQEYRGYIGYRIDGSDYLGLLPGQTITVNVPLAFWDALRVNVTTDGAVSAGGSDLLGPNPSAPLSAQLAQPNPFVFRYENTQQNNVGSTTPKSQILTFSPIYNSFKNGVPFADPTKPTTPSTIVTGMIVTGPGLPGTGDRVIAVGTNSVTLETAAGSAATLADQTNVVYTFQSTAGDIAPTERFTVDAVSGPAFPGSITNGRIMWYHASLSESPVNDAPFQLTEETFRGDYYDPAQNPGSGFQFLIGNSAFAANKFNLINYDVSYVDSMALPIAIEAQDVPIPNTQSTAPYGWVGSSQTIENMQAVSADFTGTNAAGTDTNFLGNYFGGRGYPAYYNPDPGVALKLPSGQNIFKQSPYTNTPSSYPDRVFFPDGTKIDLPLYALTSGGTGPSQLIVGGGSALPQLQPNQLELNHTADSDKALLQRLLVGLNAGQVYEVTSSLQPKSDVPPGTTLTKVLTDSHGVPTGVVELSNPTIAAYRGLHTYTFARPVTDYASTAIMSLWYSWAQYYVNYVANTLGVKAPVDLTGQVNGSQADLLVLDPNQPDASKLVPGMAVTQNGISRGIILKISGPTITLSQTTGVSGSFTFTPPALSALAGSQDTTWSLLQPFTPDGPAVDFSQTVYQVMAAMSTTVAPGVSYPSVQLLANIIGATISALPNLNTDIQVIVTNQIKSLLRGVPDFTSPKYSDQSLWYPDPSIPRGGQDFNVYNLDPFVWFVHEKLGLSGYGFSIDDDVADVGASLATHLLMSVGGLGGNGEPGEPLPNQSEWTPVAPYGPVQGQGMVVTNPADGTLSKIVGLPIAVANQVTPYNQALNLTGTLVNGPGAPRGRRS